MLFLKSEKHLIEQALLGFTNTDLFTSSINLFKALDFPVSKKQRNFGKNLDVNIYTHSFIDKSIMFNLDEFDFLEKIQSISLLFSLDKNLNVKNYTRVTSSSLEIMFLAINLHSSNRDRSFDAHNITKIFSKIYKHPIFILFHCDKNILFSGVVKDSQGIEDIGEVYLSEWFNYNTLDQKIVDSLCRISYSNHIQTHVYRFYYDLLYSISREYYIYPMSKEYLKYGCLTNELKLVQLEDDNNNSLLNFKELTEGFSDYYKNLYGDDYVDNSESIDLLLTDEDETLLMEIEEDLLLDLDDNEGLDSSNNDGHSLIDEEEGLIHEIEDGILDDPIKLLEWLEEKF
ncbi:DUF4391 domain-containing protein [Sutcliffiella cohnii]|uniref:DUF4391 domain-containing protein n=1 Tax=Sutcliffiella cohnii TaxID=33932 RepID=UPI002E1E92EE|nr:DUF4391 domain-containing protein [Sutcliffiella cohnii]